MRGGTDIGDGILIGAIKAGAQHQKRQGAATAQASRSLTTRKSVSEQGARRQALNLAT